MSHGHSDEVCETITPSTIWRSTSGTMVRQTLESAAAVTASTRSRRWSTMYPNSRRTQRTLSGWRGGVHQLPRRSAARCA